MRQYILTATLDKMTTSQAISARDDFSAKVIAAIKVNNSHVADRRYAKGELLLTDPCGKTVWKVPAEVAPAKKEEKEVKP